MAGHGWRGAERIRRALQLESFSSNAIGGTFLSTITRAQSFVSILRLSKYHALPPGSCMRIIWSELWMDGSTA
jgi:hypothetical protein